MENLAGHTKYCATQLQMAVMWRSPFQCGQVMQHTCWWAPCDQSRRLSLEQPLLTVVWKAVNGMVLEREAWEMSTPLWHCSEICILLSGSAKAAACPSSTHQMEWQWQDKHGTEHLLLAPWKAVMWLPQHPTKPCRGVMPDGGQPRPQTQSHHPERPSCKSGDTFRIKSGRWLQ